MDLRQQELRPELAAQDFPAWAWQDLAAQALALGLELSEEYFQMDSRAWAWRAEVPEVAGQLAARVEREMRTPMLKRLDTKMERPGLLACKTSSKAGSFPLCASEETWPYLVGFQTKYLVQGKFSSGQAKPDHTEI